MSDPTLAWRQENLVVVAGSGSLPKRCVLCGEVGERDALKLEEKFERTSIWLGLLEELAGYAISLLIIGAALLLWSYIGVVGAVIASLILGAVAWAVASAYSQAREQAIPKIVLEYWLCANHRRRHDKVVITFLLCVVGAVGIFLSDLYISFEHPLIVVSAEFGLVVVGFIALSRREFRHAVTKHESGQVWLSGFGKPFVDSLPPYPHAAERSSPAIVK